MNQSDERRHHLTILAATPERLTSALEQIPPADLRRRAAPGKWLAALAAAPATLAAATRGLRLKEARSRRAPDQRSIVEIVCHLRDHEAVWVERLTKVVFEDRPTFWVAEPEALARTLRYDRARLGEFREFARRRADAGAAAGPAGVCMGPSRS